MANTAKILTIDDDRLIHKIVHRTLDSRFQVLDALDGDEGLKTAQDLHPDIILLDIEMPGMNGYEVCNTLKQSSDTADIPIIFLSSLSDIQSRMRGFDVGGADFLVKPFNETELISKLILIQSYRESKAHLSDKLIATKATAFSAMNCSSELGLVIQYIERSYGAYSLEALANEFFSVTTHFDLRCSLLFSTGNRRHYFGSEGEISPLEKDLMKKICASGKRFTDFGERTQINYPNVALLVKNMPAKDKETYGRYKDFLPSMLSATDAKLSTLISKREVAEQFQEASNIVSLAQDSYSKTERNLKRNLNDITYLRQSVISELKDHVPQMGLNRDHEQYLLERIDSAELQTKAIIERGTEARCALQSISSLLNELSEKRNGMIDFFQPAIAEDQSSVNGCVDANDNDGNLGIFQ